MASRAGRPARPRSLPRPAAEVLGPAPCRHHGNQETQISGFSSGRPSADRQEERRLESRRLLRASAPSLAPHPARYLRVCSCAARESGLAALAATCHLLSPRRWSSHRLSHWEVTWLEKRAHARVPTKSACASPGTGRGQATGSRSARPGERLPGPEPAKTQPHAPAVEGR